MGDFTDWLMGRGALRKASGEEKRSAEPPRQTESGQREMMQRIADTKREEPKRAEPAARSGASKRSSSKKRE